MKSVWSIVGKIITIIILVTIVMPVGYLAWRAGQPMELPQFNGVTYYQYLNWRKDALHQMAVDYQSSHPNAKMGGGLDLCFHTETGMTLLGLSMAGFYTLAGVFPTLVKYVPTHDRQYILQDITFLNFLPSWWKTFEKIVLYMAETSIHTSVGYCRLAGTPPSPASVTP